LAISGALYKEFKEVTHANQTLGEYGFDSNRMRVYLTGDHGISNPTAWLWVAADIKGGLTVIKEYYQANATVADHAKVIDQVNAELGCVPYMVTGDPAMNKEAVSQAKASSASTPNTVSILTWMGYPAKRSRH